MDNNCSLSAGYVWERCFVWNKADKVEVFVSAATPGRILSVMHTS